MLDSKLVDLYLFVTFFLNFLAAPKLSTPATAAFRFTPPFFNIPVAQTLAAATPAIFIPQFSLPQAVFALPPTKPPVQFSAAPFIPPVVFNNPIPTTAPIPVFKLPVVAVPAPAPIPMQPWIPPGLPQFGAPITKTTVKTTTNTEYATVDIDSMIGEMESETTLKPSDEVNAFGGLDLGGMVGGFLGGFAGPAVKPADSATIVKIGVE